MTLNCRRCHCYGRDCPAEFVIRTLESGEEKPLCSMCMLIVCHDMVGDFLQRAEKLDEEKP